ncbi:MAG: hypothetical protein ACR2JY_07360 [Chloroflexota bacterium]
METVDRPERERADEYTRAERRQRRQEAERRRMPLHGKGMGVMVGNALLRRAKAAPAKDGG